ncbi:MAG: histidine kinase [Runella zeae]
MWFFHFSWSQHFLQSFRKSLFIGYFFWGICTFSLLPLHAQEFPIVNYSIREGLLQSQVLCLHKDSRGYIWCGTWFGLSKFNGETFENYTEKEGLWNGPVFDITEDDKGYLWISAGSHLARFDGKTFKKWLLPASSTSPIIKRPRGVIQMINNHQLLQVHGDTLLPVQLPHCPQGSLHGVYYLEKSNNYWLHIDNKIYQYQRGKAKLLFPQANMIYPSTLLHGNVFFVQKITPQKEVHRYWDGQGIGTFLECTLQGIKVLNTLAFPYFFVYQELLYYLPAHSTRLVSMGKNPPLAHNLSFLNQQNTSPYYIPTEKGLWKIVSIHAFQSFPTKQVPNAWSVVEDKDNNLYFLNYERGIQKYDGQIITNLSSAPFITLVEKHRHSLPRPYQHLFYFKNQWYYRALRDQTGAMWLPEANGVFRYESGRWQFFRPNYVYNLAFCLAEDKKRGKIIAASEKHFYTIDVRPPFQADSLRGKSPLFDGLVMCTAVTPDGDYWFAGLGLERYNPETKQFKAYTKENGKLPVKSGIVLYTDWQGTLWLGGRGTLCRYNPTTDRFEKLLDGYFSKLIQLIEQIDRDHLMIADPYNLYVLDLKRFKQDSTVAIKCFNHHNGFMGLEPGQLGSYRDSKGRIWVTSSSVLSVFDPQKLDLTIKPLRTFITHVNDERVAFHQQTSPITLPFGQNNVSVKVESIGEDKPFRSRFSHRLLGENDVWSPWTENDEINLINLPNGTHTLQVRSCTGTLESTTSSISTVQFTTSVYFWKSPNFYWYASLVGLLLALLLGFLWWQDRRKSKQIFAKQKQIEERERQMRLLQAQTIQSQMNPHFTSNTLAAIQRLILDQDSEKASDNLIKMGRLTRAYLEDSLFKDEKTPFAREISLTREIELLTMYVELMQLQYEGRFETQFEIEGSLNTDNYRLPPFLIQPYVENAIVHGLLNSTQVGLLKLHFFTLPDETLVCKVEDNGIGRKAAAEFQKFKTQSKSSVSTTLTAQRAKLLNQLGYHIEINVEDAIKTTGTIVTIQINHV